jgi:hypothetical protein
MDAETARTIVRSFGLDAAITALVLDAPPLTTEHVDELRRIVAIPRTNEERAA